MKVVLERALVPSVVVMDVADKELVGARVVPVGLLNDLQRAQHALDQAEIALAKSLAERRVLPDSMRPLIEPHYEGRFDPTSASAVPDHDHDDTDERVVGCPRCELLLGHVDVGTRPAVDMETGLAARERQAGYTRLGARTTP